MSNWLSWSAILLLFLATLSDGKTPGKCLVKFWLDLVAAVILITYANCIMESNFKWSLAYAAMSLGVFAVAWLWFAKSRKLAKIQKVEQSHHFDQ